MIYRSVKNPGYRAKLMSEDLGFELRGDRGVDLVRPEKRGVRSKGVFLRNESTTVRVQRAHIRDKLQFLDVSGDMQTEVAALAV